MISPLLANIALHGLEESIVTAYRDKDEPQVIRYADDVRHVTQDEILLAEKGGSEENDLRVTALT